MVTGSVLSEEVGVSVGESVGSIGTSWNGESGLLSDGCHEFREYHRGIQEGFHVAPLVNIQTGIPDPEWLHLHHRLRLGLHATQWANDAGSSISLPFPRTG